MVRDLFLDTARQCITLVLVGEVISRGIGRILDVVVHGESLHFNVKIHVVGGKTRTYEVKSDGKMMSRSRTSDCCG